MAKRINLTGTILGVGFNVTVTEGNEALIIEGETIDQAGSLPVNLVLALLFKKDAIGHVAVSGVLLGHDFKVSGSAADLDPE